MSRRLLAALLAIFAAPASLEGAEDHEGTSLRRFTVRDSIEMSHFGNLFDSTPNELDEDGLLSPDGHYLVKVTHRGILPSGRNEGTIWLFDARAMRAAVADLKVGIPRPIPLARVSAAVNGIDFIAERDNVISKLAWAKDSRSLAFLGREGRENRTLFRVEVGTQQLHALTPANQNVVDYVLSKDAIVYLTGDDRRADQKWWSAGPGIPDIVVGTGQSFGELLYPNAAGDPYHGGVRLELWQVRSELATPINDASTNGTLSIVTKYTVETLGISADGRYLAVTAAADSSVSTREKLSDADWNMRYRVFDLESGRAALLAGEPSVNLKEYLPNRYRATWSPSGTQIALTNTLSPSKGSASTGGAPCEVSVVVVATSQSQCVQIAAQKGDGFLYSLDWLPGEREIRVRFRKPGTTLYADKIIRRSNGAWAAKSGWRDPAGLPIQVTVREALDTPPVLFAMDTRSGKSRALYDPNPQLAEVALGSVRIVHWRDSHGRIIEGGLVLPPQYDKTQRYPLIIQTHGFEPYDFYREGPSDTSNAGRALAGRNMLVLQVNGAYEPYNRTWQDSAENGTKVFLAAIDQLDHEGIIDPKRVGISGYSATGRQASHAITFAPNRFAAAVLANTDPGSISNYFVSVDGVPPWALQMNAEVMAGAKPYGDGVQKWVQNAPGFSTDKITAPVLISAGDPFHLMSLWSLYASLRDQGKPVDLQYIRNGQHNLAQPLHRLAHQEAIVDWFDFWLNSHEDPDPSKADQYLRWRNLRDLKTARQPISN